MKVLPETDLAGSLLSRILVGALLVVLPAAPSGISGATSASGAKAEPATRARETRSVVTVGPKDSARDLVGKAASVKPSERQLAWQALEFQAFVHFGMNTFTDREWGLGTEDPKLFNPTDFDADQWVAAFKAVGMRGVILTAKHHDGFCLWPSRFTEHSVKNSPWRNGKGDVVREVAEACRRAGLAFGFYLSPWDRHEPSYGDSPRYNEHFKSQLRELLTNYGEISEVWFDGACGEGPNGKRQVYDWQGFWDLIRELQPKAVISIMGPDVRWIGNEAGTNRESEWSVIPVAQMDDRPAEKDPGGIAGINAMAPDLGSREAIAEVAKKGGRLIWYPAQVDVSIRPGWFYHAAEDAKVKSLDELLNIYYGSVGGNAQLLLNVPPDKRGRIHENDVRRLKELGDRLRATFAADLAAKATYDELRPPTIYDGVEMPSGKSISWLDSFHSFARDLGGAKTFNVAMLQEPLGDGQLVESFAFDIWDGRKWVETAKGTTIGYKRLLRFPTVTAAKVRVRVLESRSFSGIEVRLFLDAARMAGEPAITPIPEATPGLERFVLDQSGTWQFAAEPPARFWENAVDPSAWASIDVPGEWATQGWNLAQDVERAYRHRIDIPKEFAGHSLILRFDGVYSYARVWVNGTYVRDHHGGFTSWECDVTDLVKPGEPAWLTVGVTDMSDEISWGSNYAKHNIGGILQGVRLVALPGIHAKRLHLGTGLDAAYRVGTLKVTAGLSLKNEETADVRLTLKDPAGKPVALSPDVIKLTGAEPEKTIAIPVGEIATWDAEHPRLYRLRAEIVSGGSVQEVLTRDVGFRVIEVRGNKLLVNGREVKLRGGDRHDVHPLKGRAVTPDLDDMDARLFRDANINFIRTSHYPPTEAFLAACDRYGLYVEEENAVCFLATHGNLATSDNPAYTDRFLGQFAEMIERDRSHPSVIMWSLGNESKWGGNIRKLYEYVKKEEPTRPVIWSYPDSTPKGTAAYDIYSYHYPNFDADLKSASIPKINDEWAHVSCYNTETLKRDPGVRDFWGASIAKFWENAFTSDGCLGGAIWGLIDDVFYLPGSSCGYGEWGIIDGWRRPKPEYWHVKKAYSPIRIKDAQILDAKEGAPLRIPVKNWYDHTDLSEIEVAWSVGAKSGRMAGPKVPPHGEGMLVIPVKAPGPTYPWGYWTDKDVVHLAFSRRGGPLIDEYALPLGEPHDHFYLSGRAEIKEGSSSIIASGSEGYSVVLNKSTGLIESASLAGKTLILSGPVPDAAPAAFMPWSLTSVAVRPEDDQTKIEVMGSFAGTLAQVKYAFDTEGSIIIEYDIKERPEGASELGLSFILPADVESLSWKRNGLHSVYPADHIGRNEGTAVRVRPGDPDVYRKAPAWPWATDMADYFLFGKDHAGYGATQDFRSLKANIREAEIGFRGSTAKLRVQSYGSQSIRAEVLPDGKVKLNIISDFAYPDLGWGNDGGPKSLPGVLKGKVWLRLADGASGSKEER